MSDPAAFQDDSAKVAFATSYLDKAAFSYMATFIENTQTIHPILSNWSIFVQGLNRMFGDPDLPQTAAFNLRNMHMPEDGHFANHVIDFLHWAPYTGYGDNALTDLLYDSLAERIKDAMIGQPRPGNLGALRDIALGHDTRYWKRKAEKGQLPKSANNTSSSSNNSRNPRNTNQPSSSSTNPLAGKLDSSGHLTPEERERRKTLGLCAYCGLKTCEATCRFKLRSPQNNDTTSKPSLSASKPINRVGRVAFTVTSDGSSATNSDTNTAIPSASLTELPPSPSGN